MDLRQAIIQRTARSISFGAEKIVKGTAIGAAVVSIGVVSVVSAHSHQRGLDQQTANEKTAFTREIKEVLFDGNTSPGEQPALTIEGLKALDKDMVKLQKFFREWMLALSDYEQGDRATAGATHSELAAYFQAIDQLLRFTPLPPGANIFVSNVARAKVLDGIVRMSVAKGVFDFQTALEEGPLPGDNSFPGEFNLNLFVQGASLVNSGLSDLGVDVDVRILISDVGNGPFSRFTNARGKTIPPAQDYPKTLFSLESR